MSLLEPKKYKHRKVRKGKNDGPATRANFVAFGDWGLQSMDNSDITGRQIEAARQAISRYVNRGGKMWIRIFPHIPISRKPLDVKMGSGKGDLAFWAAKVKNGTVMFELAGVSEEVAKEALRLAGHKLPVRVKIIPRDEKLSKGQVISEETLRRDAERAAREAEEDAKKAAENAEALTSDGKNDITEGNGADKATDEKKEGDK